MAESELNISTFTLAKTLCAQLPGSSLNDYLVERGPNERYTWILDRHNNLVITVNIDTLLVHGERRSEKFERSMRTALRTIGYEINAEKPAHLGYGFLYTIRPME